MSCRTKLPTGMECGASRHSKRSHHWAVAPMPANRRDESASTRPHAVKYNHTPDRPMLHPADASFSDPRLAESLQPMIEVFRASIGRSNFVVLNGVATSALPALRPSCHCLFDPAELSKARS